MLFQCPPNLKYDPEVLDGFLADLAALNSSYLAGGHRYAMEFRHPSFDTDEVRSKLAAAGVALCVADTDEQPGTFLRTGDFAYVRLRGTGYDTRPWKGGVRRSAQPWPREPTCTATSSTRTVPPGPRDAAILKRMAEE